MLPSDKILPVGGAHLGLYALKAGRMQGVSGIMLYSRHILVIFVTQ